MSNPLQQTIEALAKEKGIEPDVVISAIEEAVATASRKYYKTGENLKTRFNTETGQVDLFALKTVVEDVATPATEISINEAREMYRPLYGDEVANSIELGDEMEFPKPTEVLGRIAAQTAKQVIFQKVREAEREHVFAEYNERIGEVVNGTVKRFENGDIILEIGRIEAVLPRKEQSRAESYTPGDRVRTVIKGVNRSAKGPQIVLSRTDPALLISIARDAPRVAFVAAGPTEFADVYVASLAPTLAGATRVSDTGAQIAAWPKHSRDVVRWTSQDGAEIEGVLHKPSDFQPGRRYPLLVVIHGGPTGVSRPVPYTNNVGYYPIDLWLARGTLVLEPNYRGSAGYGEKFRSLNVRNLGIGDAWDVLSGIDRLAADGLVDVNRVGAMGWSQGGYISAFLTTKHSDRFKAISVGAGISNWMTYYVNTDIHPFTRQYLKATPWDDPKIYADTSPMTYIKSRENADADSARRSGSARSSAERIRVVSGVARSERAGGTRVVQGLRAPAQQTQSQSRRDAAEFRLVQQVSVDKHRGDAMTAPHTARRGTRHYVRLAILLTLAIGPALPFAQVPSAQTPRPAIVAIKGGTVLTVTRGTIQNGTVILRDGKIAAVGGADTAVPAGADIIDATGRFVSPGIIDAHSHIAADSINEGGTTVSSMTGIEDVLDPTDVNIYRDLAGGLTVANVLHGSANPIGGKNQVIKLRWGKTRAAELMFEGAMPGIKFALGENPKDMRFGGGGGQQQLPPRRYPATRLGVEFVIRDAFSRAKAYQKDWQDYNRRKAAGEEVLAPRRDLQLDPLVEILEGKRLVHAHCYRADEILMLIRLADDFGFKISTFQHVLEGYKVADEIAAHGAGASTFSDWWGYKVEAEDAIPYNAALMVRRGVLVSINSDSAEHARRLNTEAAKTIHWGGLTEDEAFALVTINPAKQLRIDSRVGSVEPGKDADVVIWNKHPLSTYAIADRVYIDGLLYYDRLREEGRLTEARQEKTKLAGEAQRGPTTEPQTPRPQTATESRGGPQPVAFREQSGASAVQVIAGSVAITNARIHPMTQAVIERGTIVLRGGRIESLGANTATPSGAQVIDAQGADVYPGFIDARTVVGINEPGPRGFEDVGEMLEINAALKAHVAYQWDSDAIAVARVNGVTSVAVIPNGGLLGGQIAVMNLDGWSWEQAAVKPVAGVSFQFPVVGGGGRGGGGGGGGGGQNPERKYDDLKRERDARVKKVEDLLTQARAYGKMPAAERGVDWNLEALVPIVEGRAPLFVQANNEPEIRDAVAFGDRNGVKIVITGGLESPLVAPLLKEKNIPVILGSIMTTPTRPDLHHAATYRAAGELAQAGVTFAFGSSGYTDVRAVPYQAGISVAWGLDRERALRALTIDAAEILGVADRVGSLEPGKVANVVIWNGDPLEIRTPLPRVFIAGRDVGPDNKHLMLYQKFSNRPAPPRPSGTRSAGASAPPKGGGR